MIHNTVTITDHESAIEAIKKLNEKDLLFLNNLIVERLHLIYQAKATVSMSQFTKGDHVCFTTDDGRTIQGVVERLNKKTVSIKADNMYRWKVAPSLLSLVRTARDPLTEN